MTDKTFDISVETEAAQMVKRLRRREEIAFVLGFVLYVVAEFARLQYFENVIGLWTLRGVFIPFASLLALLVLISSVSMQSSLGNRCDGNAITQRKKCCEQLLMNKDVEGLQLLYRIAMAGTLGAFGLGMVVALATCNTFLI
ncbi:MAG: hypothetical protein HY068_12585 [Burkholderiales bacterium]|nr:hypothetical protein [Burkholderiales bacterium]